MDTIKEKIKHTTASHRKIILRDLQLAGEAGKTALAFRENYNIVDVPAAVSRINRQKAIIKSSYPKQFTVLDKNDTPRQTVKYWLIENTPRVLEVEI